MSDRYEGRSHYRRLTAIDAFRLICAVFVVGIHTAATKNMPKELDFFFTHVLFRMAVPFFCMTSGYFLADRLVFERGRLKHCDENKRCFAKTLLKNIKLYCGWSIVYLAVYIPFWKRIGWLSPWAFVDWGIAFFRSGSYYHLWYLLSLIYAWPILYVMLRWVDRRKWPFLAAGLYLYKAIGYGYAFLLPPQISRLFTMLDAGAGIATAITTIIPFALLGMMVHDEEPVFNRCFLWWMICLIALTGEAALLKRAGGSEYSYILLTFPTAYHMFRCVLCVNSRVRAINSRRMAQLSTFVYCVHPAVIAVTESWIQDGGGRRFGVVLSVSVLIGMGWIALSNRRRMKQSLAERTE